VREIIKHGRCEYLHIIAFAGVNEDIGLDLRYIAEETIHFLRSDCTHMTVLDQIEKMGHAGPFANLQLTAEPRVHVDHEDLLAHPADSFQMFHHIHGLQRGRDIADLSFGGLAIVHCNRSIYRRRLVLVRVFRRRIRAFIT